MTENATATAPTPTPTPATTPAVTVTDPTIPDRVERRRDGRKASYYGSPKFETFPATEADASLFEDGAWLNNKVKRMIRPAGGPITLHLSNSDVGITFDVTHDQAIVFYDAGFKPAKAVIGYVLGVDPETGESNLEGDKTPFFKANVNTFVAKAAKQAAVDGVRINDLAELARLRKESADMDAKIAALSAIYATA